MRLRIAEAWAGLGWVNLDSKSGSTDGAHFFIKSWFAQHARHTLSPGRCTGTERVNLRHSHHDYWSRQVVATKCADVVRQKREADECAEGRLPKIYIIVYRDMDSTFAQTRGSRGRAVNSGPPQPRSQSCLKFGCLLPDTLTSGQGLRLKLTERFACRLLDHLFFFFFFRNKRFGLKIDAQSSGKA